MPSITVVDIPDIADVHLAQARIDKWTRLTPVISDPGHWKSLTNRDRNSI